MRGIKAAKPGREVNVIGRVIESYANRFGYAELGTVTAKAQPGTPSPRLFRLKADRGILNRMGFNNEGAAVAARHLRARKTMRLRMPRSAFKRNRRGDGLPGCAFAVTVPSSA